MSLKQKLLELGKSWNASGEYDDTEFEGRYFIGDDDLEEFSLKHKIHVPSDDEDVALEKIEQACACKLVYDYEGANPSRQTGDQEIIFNRS